MGMARHARPRRSASSQLARRSRAGAQPICPSPQIINQPQDQAALSGTTVSLTVGFIGTSPTVTWYQGAKGDTSKQAGSGQTITSPVLTQTTQFWARIANSCGSVDSNAATITVTPRVSHRRAVSH